MTVRQSRRKLSALAGSPLRDVRRRETEAQVSRASSRCYRLRCERRHDMSNHGKAARIRAKQRQREHRRHRERVLTDIIPYFFPLFNEPHIRCCFTITPNGIASKPDWGSESQAVAESNTWPDGWKRAYRCWKGHWHIGTHSGDDNRLKMLTGRAREVATHR